MDFAESLRSSAFSAELKADTKEGIIEEMIDLMVARGNLPAETRDEALRCVLEREDKMSTGMQYGVAMPHGKCAAVERLYTAIALKKEGVDFESLDGEPSRIFVMTVSSAATAGPHMRYLAEAGRLLGSRCARQKVLEAHSLDDVIAVFTGW